MASYINESKRQALLIGINKYPNLGSRYDLNGCINDVELMALTLRESFGFSEGDITILKDEQATREGILAALDRVLETASENEIVVIHYSGHGSRVRDREGDESDGWDETIVPYDSGRKPLPNLDITDDEIYLFLLKLTNITPFVTLIFDCCHSGTMSRDDFGASIRFVKADDRPVDQLPPSPIPREFIQSLTRDIGPSGWVPLSKKYVLLAACRDNESAFEHNAKGVDHGAFTYFLNTELSGTESGATYRDVFECASISITAQYPRQHPQMEGACDRSLFGIEIINPMPFVAVKLRSNDLVVLGAGAAHGLTLGSLWAVRPQSAKKMTDPCDSLGMVEVSKIRAVTAEARIRAENKPGLINVGARAFEYSHFYDEMSLVVGIKAPEGFEVEMAEFADLMSRSKLLSLATSFDEADARAHIIPPREQTAESDSVPQLANIVNPIWAVVGKDGLLQIPTCKLDEPQTVIKNLEKAAKYKIARDLRNVNKGSLLKDKIQFRLKRKDANDQWSIAEPDYRSGHVIFTEGERVAIEIENNHDAPVYFSILDFGVAGEISQLYPPQGANEELVPGKPFEIGTRKGQEILLYLPDNFPYAPDPSDRSSAEGVEVFKLFASTHEADFSILIQSGFRDAGDLKIKGFGTQLWDLLDQAFWGNGNRDAKVLQALPEEEWTTKERYFILRRS